MAYKEELERVKQNHKKQLLSEQMEVREKYVNAGMNINHAFAQIGVTYNDKDIADLNKKEAFAFARRVKSLQSNADEVEVIKPFIRLLATREQWTRQELFDAVEKYYPINTNQFKKMLGKHKVNFEGQEMSYKVSYGTHIFSKAELESLDSGKTISFSTMSKNGVRYKVKGKLAIQTYKGNTYLGFKPNN
ncbi:hypothetical protein [Ligilactobacillus equi]|uniref:Topoisomerase-like protein n=2 Tax=Ligilactobacillus equi TaxID=137357 RepID=V7HZC9_9LACO|nr:hypothetical protein [Ligilactobacillus equi]ETA74563.1 topoisomerase-like protein [Ligilactobacillus equi DPC 6820]KRL84346.1 hypothetical protein FC36_GL000269 [Ligilactobacillus equi DSM 15833 = JCM 10991]